MDLHGASVDCDRCGAEMHTSVGVTYSDWMAKKRADDKELHCGSCRSELADPAERSLDLEIDSTDQGVEFTVVFDNPTEESIMFSLTDLPEGGQWNDDDRWQQALEECEGVVGTLEVRDAETGDTVFEHVFRLWASRRRKIPEYAMGVGGNRTRSLTTTWGDDERLAERDRYVARQAPFEGVSEIEATFRLLVDEDGWPTSQVHTRQQL